MGLSNSKQNSETINWNNLKTENMSSSMSQINALSNEAKKLIASLNIPEFTDAETSEMSVTRILNKINTGLNVDDKQRFNKILEEVSSQSEELSDTSPFISSEMYEYLVNSKTSEDMQKGGAKKSKKNKKGGSLDNDSSTSSTSSDSSIEDILDSTEEEIIKEKNKKHKKSKDSSDSEMSGGDLSYLSSSAHTGGEFSDSESNKNSDDNSVESSSETVSSVQKSVSDENKTMMSTSVSVNTEDINMISDY